MNPVVKNHPVGDMRVKNGGLQRIPSVMIWLTSVWLRLLPNCPAILPQLTPSICKGPAHNAAPHNSQEVAFFNFLPKMPGQELHTQCKALLGNGSANQSQQNTT
jgi:hypothetical protein|mmetsp:Transcript_37949/g.62983  ORF Transcript_37949/g.62983 Transcript_37949/m.62983 type:complete len:104 (+) Transcript_37949:1688-1999(+)